jgi:phosphoglycerate dehydrogenase-like enzyme
VEADDVVRALAGADVLVTGWCTPRLDDAVYEAAGSLALVAHTAAAVRGLFGPELYARGIRATHAAIAMADAVAEHCLTLTLALLRHLHLHDRLLQGGAGWDAAQAPGLGRELASCTVSVVGASRTGRAYARMVAALGAHVLVHDPYLAADEAAALGVEPVGLDEALRRADVLALHAPSTPETHRMVGARELGLLRDGALLVNTGRSWLVEPAALLAEARSGRILAALDVFEVEPIAPDDPLLGLPNVLLTPHVAGGTVQARHRQGAVTVEEVRRFLAGEPLRYEITAARYEIVA